MANNCGVGILDDIDSDGGDVHSKWTKGNVSDEVIVRYCETQVVEKIVNKVEDWSENWVHRRYIKQLVQCLSGLEVFSPLYKI